MDMQWWVLGTSLALTALTISALVSPNWLVRDNVIWSACSGLAGEYAGWLAGASLVLAVWLASTAGASADEPTRLATLLLLGSAAGLLLVALRARRTPVALETALQRALGHGYLGETPAGSGRARGSPPLHATWARRPAAVERIADLPYPGGHARNRLDVYRPATGCSDAPVLLLVHGGGWTQGDKRKFGVPPLVHALVARGWIVVAPNYRLAPAVRMPAPLVDLKAAMAWVRGHIADHGGDPSFVAVGGGGTGAHLAALLALTFREPELQPGFEYVDTRPAACVPLHGVYDLADRRHRHPGRGARLRWLATHLMPCALERDTLAWEMASPLALLRCDAPPFFVLHGTHDALCPVEEAREFSRELARVSDEPVAYAELAGAHHGWDRQRSARARHTLRAIAGFLEWCAARHRAQGSRLGSEDRARS